jgi:hypothetical protein
MTGVGFERGWSKLEKGSVANRNMQIQDHIVDFKREIMKLQILRS